jgi:hypothetical protein
LRSSPRRLRRLGRELGAPLARLESGAHGKPWIATIFRAGDRLHSVQLNYLASDGSTIEVVTARPSRTGIVGGDLLELLWSSVESSVRNNADSVRNTVGTTGARPPTAAEHRLRWEWFVEWRSQPPQQTRQVMLSGREVGAVVLSVAGRTGVGLDVGDAHVVAIWPADIDTCELARIS